MNGTTKELGHSIFSHPSVCVHMPLCQLILTFMRINYALGMSFEGSGVIRCGRVSMQLMCPPATLVEQPSIHSCENLLYKCVTCSIHH